mgnify:FL=1
MRQFLKYVLATVVGIFLFSVVMFFIFVGVGSMLSSSSDDAVEVKANSVLKIDLNTTITEQATKDDPFDEIFASGEKKSSLHEIKAAIANAKLDPNIKGISIKLETPMAGFAEIEELRNVLIDFKKLFFL